MARANLLLHSVEWQITWVIDTGCIINYNMSQGTPEYSYSVPGVTRQDTTMCCTQLCKLRGTSDTFIGRASICKICFCELTYDMIIDTQFHKNRSRVFYVLTL